MADIKKYIKKVMDGTVSLEEQQKALAQVEKTIIEAKQKRDEAVGQKADMVIQALKTIEAKLEAKLVELNNTPAKQGIQGPQGPAGRDGRDGVDGYKGSDGRDGVDGKDGKDGKDGVSVVDAQIDFDGSLVIKLSDGSEIDAGTVLSLDVAKQIHSVSTNGGGTSQSVLDSIAALQTQITAIANGSINLAVAPAIGTVTPNIVSSTSLTTNTAYIEGGNNLLPYSEQFDNGNWVKTATNITANAVASPDGTTTADKAVPDNTLSRHRAYEFVSVTSGTTYTASIYAKAAGYNFVAIREDATTGNAASFDLSLGTVVVSNGGTATISSVGNGWYRCTFTTVSGGTGFSLGVQFLPNSYTSGTSITATWTGDGTSGVYLWGAQLEQAITASGYTPTTTAAVSTINTLQLPSTGRILVNQNYDQGTGGLQVTGNSAFNGTVSDKQLAMVGGNNLLTYSEQFDNAAWGKTAVNVTVNSTTAPDGTTTADSLIEDSTTGSHVTSRSYTATIGTPLTWSVYAKANTRTIIRLSADGAAITAFFDLSSGTITSGSGSIVPVGNGWYRCSISTPYNVTGNSTAYIWLVSSGTTTSYTGNGTSGVYLWGGQLETLPFASTYTQTVASAVSTINDIYLPSGAVRNGTWNQGTGSLQITGNTSVNGTAVNKTVVLAGGNNQLKYSQDFDNAYWIKNAATVTANSTSAPDGTTTADTLLATAGTSVIPRLADTSLVTVNGSAITVSLYAKSNTYSYIQFYINSQATEWANFTLSGNGTATTNGTSSATITPVGNGWYRLTFTYTAGGVDRLPFFMLAASASATRAQAWNPAGTESAYIWGAQLETGTVASAYTATTSAAVSASNQVLVSDGSVSAPALSFNTGSNFGLYKSGTAIFGSASGTNIWFYNGTGFGIYNTIGLSLNQNGDTILRSDASNTVGQRNGVNAQTYNLYNTYTDASNYERFTKTWSSNTLLMNAQAAGTGTVRNIGLQTVSGSVGIGTASPTQGKLVVKDANKAFDGYGNTNIFTTDAAGSDVGGSIALGGENSQTTTPYVFGKIKAAKESGGSWNGYMSFGTTSNTSAVVERMRITSTGNVGIGVTPNANIKLDVDGVIKAKGYTVATLPTGVVGATAYVTDALAPMWGAVAVGGGAVTVPVFYNGTNWITA